MTATLDPEVRPSREPNGMLWNSMPGWGITANLLPPEVVTARRVRVLRKVVMVVIAAVFALGVAGYAYGYLQKGDANSELAAAQARTSELTAQQAKYDGVVTLTGQISQVKQQLSQLLAGDVNAYALLSTVVGDAPQGGISTVTMVMNTGQGAAAPPIPDASGHLPVGVLTVTGDTKSMANVATSVDRLRAVPGLAEIYPSTQQAQGSTVKYTIQITLIDQIYSHRWDFTPAPATTTPGGN